ncbi:MAG: hypothetical protein AAFR87_35555, partial [Bacteroidota bacterium]
TERAKKSLVEYAYYCVQTDNPDKSQDIPIDQILECLYSPSKRFDDYPDFCLDCLSVRNSTHTRPDFF